MYSANDEFISKFIFWLIGLNSKIPYKFYRNWLRAFRKYQQKQNYYSFAICTKSCLTQLYFLYSNFRSYDSVMVIIARKYQMGDVPTHRIDLSQSVLIQCLKYCHFLVIDGDTVLFYLQIPIPIPCRSMVTFLRRT